MLNHLQSIYPKLAKPNNVRGFVKLISEMHRIVLNHCLEVYENQGDPGDRSALAQLLNDERERFNELVGDLPQERDDAQTPRPQVHLAAQDQLARQDFLELSRTKPKSEKEQALFVARFYATFRRFVELIAANVRSEKLQQILMLLSRYFCDQTRKVLVLNTLSK